MGRRAILHWFGICFCLTAFIVSSLLSFEFMAVFLSGIASRGNLTPVLILLSSLLTAFWSGALVLFALSSSEAIRLKADKLLWTPVVGLLCLAFLYKISLV
jgi:hypothetical protein